MHYRLCQPKLIGNFHEIRQIRTDLSTYHSTERKIRFIENHPKFLGTNVFLDAPRIFTRLWRNWYWIMGVTMELTPTNIFLGEILPSKCDFVVEFHLKFTDTKNLIFITHNLLPGNSSLTFTFKSKKKTFPFVRNLNPYLVIPKYCKFVHLKVSSVIQEN